MLLVRIIGILAFISYPAAVYWFITNAHPEYAAAFVLAAALVSLAVKRNAVSLAVAVVAAVLATAAFCMNQALPVKFYPVAVNLAWLFAFASSLGGTPAIERFARMRHPDLDEYAQRYCRKATVAWCVFFIFNASVAFDSAVFRSDEWWALYNGAVSYVLIGVMFALEFCVRIICQKRNK